MHVTHYVAVLIKTPDSDYTVEFPDFPGAVTAGKTPIEAVAMAVECLDLHITGLLSDRELCKTVSRAFNYSLIGATDLAIVKHGSDFVTAFYVPFFRPGAPR